MYEKSPFEFIEGRVGKPEYNWCLANIVSFTHSGESIFLVGKLSFGLGISPKPRGVINYGRTQFYEELIPLETVFDVISGKCILHVNGLELKLQSDSWRYYSPSDWPFHLGDEPLHFFETYADKDSERRQHASTLFYGSIPFGKFNGPSFENMQSAVSFWMDWPVYHGNSDGRNGNIIVTFPLETGEVKDVRMNERDAIEVIIVPGMEELTVQIAATVDGKHIWRDLSQDGKVWVCDVPISGRCAVFVFQGEEVISDWRGTPKTYRGEERPSYIVELIRQGENEEVEFKDIDRKPPDSWDDHFVDTIVRTVVAFTNTKGGRILLGVKDDGSLAGLGGGFLRLGEDYSDREKEFERLFRKYICEFISKLGTVTISYPNIGSRRLAVVKVEKGTSGIASTFNNIPYIRRGATSSRATPEEIIHLHNKDSDPHVYGLQGIGG